MTKFNDIFKSPKTNKPSAAVKPDTKYGSGVNFVCDEM